MSALKLFVTLAVLWPVLHAIQFQALRYHPINSLWLLWTNVLRLAVIAAFVVTGLYLVWAYGGVAGRGACSALANGWMR